MRRYAPFNIRSKSVTCLGTALNTLLLLGVLWLVQVPRAAGSSVPLDYVPTGTRSNQRVTLTMGDMPLTGKLQGNTLLLPVTEVTGHQGIQIWYTSSQSDYNALVAAFTTNAHLSFALANLGICNQLYSPGDALFRLTPYAPPGEALSQTTIAEQRAQVCADWHAAWASTLPSVPGLPLSWVISASTEARVEQQAMSLYGTLQTTLLNDYTKVTALERLAQQVAQIKRAHRCELRERERKCP